MTTSDASPVAFLKAQLDEEEATARKASAGPWTVATAKTAECDELAILSNGGGAVVGSGYEGGGVWDRADADHIARHDPARTLREVAAKRAVLDMYEKQQARVIENAMEEDRAWLLWRVVQVLASGYGYRPDGE